MNVKRSKAGSRLRAWNQQMLADADADTEKGTRRGTRWGRSTAALLPSGVVVAVLGFFIAQGVLAASFNVANQQFTLNVDQLNGKGLGAVLAAENVKNLDSSSGRTGVLHAGLASADLQGLCIVVHQSLMGVKYTITVGAGGAVKSNGQNLFFDITDLSATPATLRNAILGRSADEVAVNGTSLNGSSGGFGLDVTRGTVSLQKVKGSAYQAQVAGSLTLPNLAINVKLGESDSC